MNNIVKTEAISFEKLNSYLNKGWQVMEKQEDGQYIVGLPIEQAYQQMRELFNFLANPETIEYELKRRADLHNEYYDEYDHVERKFIQGYGKEEEATHYISSYDLFNDEVNRFFSLLHPYQETLFAKRLISES